jgi:hypothetical protein
VTPRCGSTASTRNGSRARAPTNQAIATRRSRRVRRCTRDRARSASGTIEATHAAPSIAPAVCARASHAAAATAARPTPAICWVIQRVRRRYARPRSDRPRAGLVRNPHRAGSIRPRDAWGSDDS